MGKIKELFVTGEEIMLAEDICGNKGPPLNHHV